MPGGSDPLNSRRMQKLTALLCLIVFSSVNLMAVTITGSSPSLRDVQTAISSAADGDTVIVPAGTARWTSTLLIDKPVTLVGQTSTDPVAGTAVDKTIIQDDVTRVPGGAPIIKIISVLGKTYRVSGFTFQGLATTKNNNGAIQLTGNSHAIRLDHCHFQPMPGQGPYVAIMGPIYGVADHNVLECPRVASFSFYMANWPYPDGKPAQNGDGSWASPTDFGSEKFFFVEDNCLKNITASLPKGFQEGGGHTDDLRGGRWVFRHNHCYDIEMQTHGTEGGRFRGGRAREIYHNDFHNTHAHGTGGIRSGVTITHDNTYDGVQPTHGLVLEAYRAFFKWKSQSLPWGWGGATGDNPWDVNDTEGNGTNISGHSPFVYASGTVSSGSGTTLVDITKNWAPNQWQYFTAKRLSDNQVAFIKSNTNNTLELLYYTDSGGGAIWKAGDQYQIRRPLILLDQPGRGQGDMITGTSPVNRATGKATWPHQALEPSYSWNDTYTPRGESVNFKTGAGNHKLQQEGRDYYNNTPMLGYKPYTYPHPLVSGGASVPPGPQKIQRSGSERRTIQSPKLQEHSPEPKG